MARKRTTDTAEFKLQAVRMILDQRLSVAEVARRLGVGENLLHTWRKAFRQQGRRLSPDTGSPARRTTNCDACGPRTPACGPSGTCYL